MMEPSRLNIFTVLVILNQIWTSGGEDSEIKILTRPQTFQRPINSNITLPCSVRNLDGSVVTWSKDGQVISADNFKVLKDSRITVNHLPNRGHNQPFPWGTGGNLTVPGEVLLMTNITRAYSGDYMCSADNGVGSYPVRESISIDVLYPPEVHIERPWVHA